MAGLLCRCGDGRCERSATITTQLAPFAGSVATDDIDERSYGQPGLGGTKPAQMLILWGSVKARPDTVMPISFMVATTL